MFLRLLLLDKNRVFLFFFSAISLFLSGCFLSSAVLLSPSGSCSMIGRMTKLTITDGRFFPSPYICSICAGGTGLLRGLLLEKPW